MWNSILYLLTFSEVYSNPDQQFDQSEEVYPNPDQEFDQSEVARVIAERVAANIHDIFYERMFTTVNGITDKRIRRIKFSQFTFPGNISIVQPIFQTNYPFMVDYR